MSSKKKKHHHQGMGGRSTQQTHTRTLTSATPTNTNTTTTNSTTLARAYPTPRRPSTLFPNPTNNNNEVETANRPYKGRLRRAVSSLSGDDLLNPTSVSSTNTDPARNGKGGSTTKTEKTLKWGGSVAVLGVVVVLALRVWKRSRHRTTTTTTTTNSNGNGNGVGRWVMRQWSGKRALVLGSVCVALGVGVFGVLQWGGGGGSTDDSGAKRKMSPRLRRAESSLTCRLDKPHDAGNSQKPRGGVNVDDERVGMRMRVPSSSSSLSSVSSSINVAATATDVDSETDSYDLISHHDADVGDAVGAVNSRENTHMGGMLVSEMVTSPMMDLESWGVDSMSSIPETNAGGGGLSVVEEHTEEEEIPIPAGRNEEEEASESEDEREIDDTNTSGVMRASQDLSSLIGLYRAETVDRRVESVVENSEFGREFWKEVERRESGEFLRLGPPGGKGVDMVVERSLSGDGSSDRTSASADENEVDAGRGRVLKRTSNRPSPQGSPLSRSPVSRSPLSRSPLSRSPLPPRKPSGPKGLQSPPVEEPPPPYTVSSDTTTPMPPTTLSLPGHGLQSLPTLSTPHLMSLTHLQLPNNALTSLPLPVLPNMKHLDLRGNRLTAMPDLHDWHSLEACLLDDNIVPALSSAALSGCTGLTYLSLTGCALAWIAPETFTHTPQLQHLHLAQNQLATLPASLGTTRLETLDVSGNPMDPTLLMLMRERPALIKKASERSFKMLLGQKRKDKVRMGSANSSVSSVGSASSSGGVPPTPPPSAATQSGKWKWKRDSFNFGTGVYEPGGATSSSSSSTTPSGTVSAAMTGATIPVPFTHNRNPSTSSLPVTVSAISSPPSIISLPARVRASHSETDLSSITKSDDTSGGAGVDRVRLFLQDLWDTHYAHSHSPLHDSSSHKRKNKQSSTGSIKKRKQDPSKASQLVKELLTTEQTYVRELSALWDLYAAPSRGVLPGDVWRDVFECVGAIVDGHRAALGDLKLFVENGDMKGVSTVVYGLMRDLRDAYEVYFVSFEDIAAKVESLITEKPTKQTQQQSPTTTGGTSIVSFSSGFKILSEAARLDERHKSQIGVQGFLILPVQRLPRYKMLLETMVRCCGPDSMEDVQRAMDEVEGVVGRCNDAKRVVAGKRVLARIVAVQQPTPLSTDTGSGSFASNTSIMSPLSSNPMSPTPNSSSSFSSSLFSPLSPTPSSGLFSFEFTPSSLTANTPLFYESPARVHKLISPLTFPIHHIPKKLRKRITERVMTVAQVDGPKLLYSYHFNAKSVAPPSLSSSSASSSSAFSSSAAAQDGILEASGIDTMLYVIGNEIMLCIAVGDALFPIVRCEKRAVEAQVVRSGSAGVGRISMVNAEGRRVVVYVGGGGVGGVVRGVSEACA
ncbi:hypothetical protein HDU85_001269 [Gaertneriomyces sp. JEL0708]|nr:hypothetical protein HDU85_001269 [Gaertneriomyces sp. JEL0708]